MKTTADINNYNVNQGEVCRHCGTFTHIEGSKIAEFPLGRYNSLTGARDLTAAAWHASAACVDPGEPLSANVR